MHIGQWFRPADARETLHLVNDIRFGTLVTRVENVFDATPIPWVAEQEGDSMTLWAHLANANPQLQAVRTSSDVLLVFTGANGYVSPRGLPTPRSAPTWNYIAMHVHGRCEVLDATATEFAVEKLVAAMENSRAEPWTTAEMEERRTKLLRHVTGLRVTARRIDAKCKLGQNESDTDLPAILRNLEAEGKHELVRAMRAANTERLPAD